jgi:pimeloyl-ACP methyl ester carboxylesterase
VLIGHSMGGAAAAEGVIHSPDGVDALVLVAPAIVALWLGPPEQAAGDPVAAGLAVVEELVGAEDGPGELASPPGSPPLSRSSSDSGEGAGAAAAGGLPRRGRRPLTVAQRARRGAHTVAVVAKAFLLLLVRLALAAATPVLVLLLRRLVRTRR